jgi:hypothetical protein
VPAVAGVAIEVPLAVAYSGSFAPWVFGLVSIAARVAPVADWAETM